MIYFNCDYTEGCHPSILEAMAASNFEQTVGYGEDDYCEQARGSIRRACGAPNAGVHFLVGGTQANFTVIRSALRPHQGVISPATGHINVHETGAVEATGHKVLAVPCGKEGKISAAQVEALCDVFYIGGTKCGALFGEAVVISNPELNRDFRYAIKQNGGMLAKGRLLGLQFKALFENGLYQEICRKANEQAYKIAAACREAGFGEYAPSPTNQQFFIFPDEILGKLQKKYCFSFWEKVDETHSAVRICTSWATKDENVTALIGDIRALGANP